MAVIRAVGESILNHGPVVMLRCKFSSFTLTYFFFFLKKDLVYVLTLEALSCASFPLSFIKINKIPSLFIKAIIIRLPFSFF